VGGSTSAPGYASNGLSEIQGRGEPPHEQRDMILDQKAVDTPFVSRRTCFKNHHTTLAKIVLDRRTAACAQPRLASDNVEFPRPNKKKNNKKKQKTVIPNGALKRGFAARPKEEDGDRSPTGLDEIRPGFVLRRRRTRHD